MNPIIESLKGRLIVSVQAYPGEPLRTPEHMAAMSRACELGGAAAIRCQGLSDIAAIKGRVEIPVIGLWKDGHEGVYITPTLRHARACIAAGADIVAIDATDRPRPDGKTLEDTVRPLKEEGILLMADCMTIEDIRRAVELGFDLVSTTLSHNKPAIETTLDEGPDLPLLRQATSEFPNLPIICEGHVHSPPPRAAPPSTPVPGPWWWALPSRTPQASPAGSRPRLRSRPTCRPGIYSLRARFRFAPQNTFQEYTPGFKAILTIENAPPHVRWGILLRRLMMP